MDGAFVIGVLILVLLVVFAVIFIVGWNVAREQASTPALVVTTEGGFLSSCRTTSCAPGLVCDGATFLCKLGEGAVCTEYSDCAVGAVCSGVCATGATGGLNQLCPCNQGYICTASTNNRTVCKAAPGTVCTGDGDCASGRCVNGICGAGFPLAAACNVNSNCASGNCSNGFCQPSGVVSGQQGAACAGICVGFTGAACSDNLVCACNPTGGICSVPDVGLVGSCSPSSLCAVDLICFGPSAGACTGTGCLCLFPYTDPNVVAPGSVCLQGMGEFDNACYNATGFGCDNGGQCLSRECGGSSAVVGYKFSSGNANLAGSTATSLFSFPGPPGLISPRKLFATSAGAIDTLYLVEGERVLSARYNPSSGTVVANWEVVETPTGAVRDVATNGIDVLIGIRTPTGDVLYRTTATGLTFDGAAPAPIDFVSLSYPNSSGSGGDILVKSGGTIYRRIATGSTYSIATVVGGPMSGLVASGLATGPPAAFYYNDNSTGTCPAVATGPARCSPFENFSLVGPFQSYEDPVVHPQLLQFSGDIAGIGLPIDRFGQEEYTVLDYSIYSQQPGGMSAASVIILARDNTGDTNIFLSFGGTTAQVPLRVSDTVRVAASANSMYSISLGSCT